MPPCLKLDIPLREKSFLDKSLVTLSIGDPYNHNAPRSCQLFNRAGQKVFICSTPISGCKMEYMIK